MSDATEDITPAALSAEELRIKAVTMPVSMIEEIDAKRGDVSFSRFIIASVKEHLKDR